MRPILDIVSHPRFERLRRVSQLGTTLFVFPGATHNRFEHALGVYSKALRFANKMAEEGFLTNFEARNVPIFGLLHDIGHGPFSHLIEELVPYDHDKNGLKVIDEMRNEIESSGADFSIIKKIFARKTPLYKIIMDKNLGMDKLDYLERDTFHTGFGSKPDIESVFNYLSYLKGGLVIDKKSLEAAKQIQRLYLYMYKEVYLHKSSLISQRFLQKIIAIWLSLHKVNPEELWALSDHELLAKIYTDPDERLRYLYKNFIDRKLPSTGLVFRMHGNSHRERLAGKEIKVMSEDREFFEGMARHSSPSALQALEEQIAELLNVPDHMILVVPTLSPERFAPEDIMYHDEGKILSLRETQTGYFESMRGELEGYLAVRVSFAGNRRIIYENAAKIHQLMRRHISGAPAEPKNLKLIF
jgi:HD superfamily phosphohydrolase